MILEPKYQFFMVRVWLQIYKTILILAVVIIIIALMSEVNLIYAFLIGILPVCTLLFIRSIFINKYCLKLIEINETDQYVKLVILKYNKDFKISIISLNDLIVRMNPIFFSLRPYYRLQFLKSRFIVYEQGESIQWPLELLQDVLNKIINIQKQKEKLT